MSTIRNIHTQGAIVEPSTTRRASYSKEYTGPVCAICSKPAKVTISSIMMCVACYKEHQADVTGKGRECRVCKKTFDAEPKTARFMCDRCLKQRPYQNKCVREG